MTISHRAESVTPNDAPSGRGRPTIDVAGAHARVHPWRWVTGAALVVLGAALAHLLVTNPNFQWDVVVDYLFYPSILKGLGVSVLLAVIAMVLGTAIGVFLALAQLGDFAPARWASSAFVAVFRSIPPLVQLIFWFNLGFLIPRLEIGLPGGPSIGSWSTTELITPLSAAIIGLTLHEAAYMSEIIRSGLVSIPSGQRDAAKAVGFTPRTTFFRIVVPQAMRVVLPPFGNQFIATVKGTSLVSVIAMSDLLFSVQLIADRTYQIVPMLIVACVWYLAVITVLTYGQRILERRYGRGFDAVARRGHRRWGGGPR